MLDQAERSAPHLFEDIVGKLYPLVIRVSSLMQSEYKPEAIAAAIGLDTQTVLLFNKIYLDCLARHQQRELAISIAVGMQTQLFRINDRLDNDSIDNLIEWMQRQLAQIGQGKSTKKGVVFRLTPRQIEIFRLLTQGYSLKDIKNLMGPSNGGKINIRTVRTHLYNLQVRIDEIFQDLKINTTSKGMKHSELVIVLLDLMQKTKASF